MSSNDFSIPQRQSAIGVIVMFADTFQKLVRALVPLLIPVILNIRKIGMLPIIIGILVFVVIVAVVAYLKYRNFTFMLDEDNEEFVIKSGIWNKSRLAIPLDKIQQVNINQSLLQRLIGVHALEIDTAGSSGNEAKIKAVDHDLAQALKLRLLDTDKRKGRVTADDDDTIPATDEAPLIEISFLSLFKTGITSNYARSFALLFAFCITTFQHIDDFVKAAGYDSNPLDDYINPRVLLKFITTIVMVILVLILMINLVRTIFKFFGFKITRQRNALLLSHGLLNTRNTIIRPDKVQVVTTSRNFFQKKLNINDLRIRQATDMEASTKQQQQTATEIPGCSTIEKDALLEMLLQGHPHRGQEVKPNIRKLILGVFLSIAIPVGIYYLLASLVSAELREYQVFALIYAAFAFIMVYFNYRNNRLFVSDDFIIKQSGAWDIANDYIAPHRIQSLTLHQFFWQVGSNVGTIKIHTAGGSISFGVANFAKMKELANYWLYQVETTNKGWM